MITRGHLIGEILDELSNIGNQVNTRNGLGLTDLNRHLENFFKQVLNSIFNLKLENLNAERSNNPGIDLGDRVNRAAFQITSTKTSDKINETLKSMTQEHLSEFDKIRVLIIGKKQGSYTLNPGKDWGHTRRFPFLITAPFFITALFAQTSHFMFMPHASSNLREQRLGLGRLVKDW